MSTEEESQTEEYSIIQILEDGSLEDSEITEAILRMISEDGGDSGVLMAFNQVQGTAVLNVTLKDGHAVDLNGNTINIEGLGISATLNIGGGAIRTYVYYPGYEISQSGLPSLDARALPFDITPIGISFVWEQPEREYEMPVFRENSMKNL